MVMQNNHGSLDGKKQYVWKVDQTVEDVGSC